MSAAFEDPVRTPVPTVFLSVRLVVDTGAKSFDKGRELESGG